MRSVFPYTLCNRNFDARDNPQVETDNAHHYLVPWVMMRTCIFIFHLNVFFFKKY